nr:unnamed protein product [Callosobruchus analis]
MVFANKNEQFYTVYSVNTIYRNLQGRVKIQLIK